MNKNVARRAVALSLLASTVSGCVVSPKQVAQDHDEATARVAREMVRLEKQARNEPLVVDVDSNYLGSRAIPLSASTILPPPFHDAQIAMRTTASLDVLARQVSRDLKIPVRLNPDVWASARMGAERAQTGSANAGQARAVPAGYPPGTPFGGASGPAASPLRLADVSAIYVDFSGDGATALNAITAPAGLSWSYSADENAVTIYRYLSKTFPLATGLGSFKTESSSTRGANTQSGNTGSGTSIVRSPTGTFAANSHYAADSGKRDPLAAALEVIKASFLDTGEKATANPVTNEITVTGTRYTLDRVSKFMDEYNGRLSKQAQIRYETVIVQLDDSTDAGFDIQAIYTKMLNGVPDWTLKFAGATSIVGQGAGSTSFNVLRPSSGFNGTQAAVEALNRIGTIIGRDSKTLITKNFVPVHIADFTTENFLGQTQPAYGGTVGGGAGVPGLTPGQTTYGYNLNITPTIFDSNTIELNLSASNSDVAGRGSAQTGDGATFQQIQWVDTKTSNNENTVQIRQGETLVLIGLSADSTNSTRQYGMTGLSSVAKKGRLVKIVLVTPAIIGAN